MTNKKHYYDFNTKQLLRYTIEGDSSGKVHYGWYPVRVPSKWAPNDKSTETTSEN
tara:strand:+ start:312 stop:476 length:165 start_codon:yes stop_codon:yes gene_type:complete